MANGEKGLDDLVSELLSQVPKESKAKKKKAKRRINLESYLVPERADAVVMFATKIACRGCGSQDVHYSDPLRRQPTPDGVFYRPIEGDFIPDLPRRVEWEFQDSMRCWRCFDLAERIANPADPMPIAAPGPIPLEAPKPPKREPDPIPVKPEVDLNDLMIPEEKENDGEYEE